MKALTSTREKNRTAEAARIANSVSGFGL
jgi:hypothetical protein